MAVGYLSKIAPFDGYAFTPSGDPFITLENDGCYAFLLPYLRDIEGKIGKLIDLYSDAIFSGEELGILLSTVVRAIADVERKPTSWLETVGWNDTSRKDPIQSPVEKDQLLGLLLTFQSTIQSAMATGQALVFIGD